MISQYGHTQCLEILLEKHPKLVTRNKDGVSPMDVAYNKEILAVSIVTNSLTLPNFVDLLRVHKSGPKYLCYPVKLF